MDALTQFFIDYGYLGMALASFLAGTFFPFSSEAVMVALLLACKLDPVIMITSGTIGNVAGSMFNYYIGTLGDMQTISRWFKVKPEKLQKTQMIVSKYGIWSGLFTFLPVIGTAIAIALGLARANIWLTLLSVTTGKLVRYIIVVYSVIAIA